MVRRLASLVVKRELSAPKQTETGIGDLGIELDPSVFLDLLKLQLNIYQRSAVLDRQGHDETSVGVRLAFND